ncbi:hypothetical protein K2173_027421 [Erythroxylum novogranatense]|uniref:Phospholipid/glycerol acyltransferase domain-containing protein n=1 Tax=Erythroxylum novogranatense TaxID=1862640 RepID=A0AAV8U285_9ROSI|nr:hypothetical protein K2173_027421 [Erythroxylum novogranatense]
MFKRKMTEFGTMFNLKTLLSLSRLLNRLGTLPSHQPKVNNSRATNFTTFQKRSSLVHHSKELSEQTVVFDFEGTLLRSSSLFAYFMLVILESGGLLRALALLLLYPLICSVRKELGLKIMVFISFFGVRKDKFRIGTAVLPKFFLEDIGREGFDLVMRYGRKIAVSDLPRIMVEGVLRDYLGAEAAVGRELKAHYGYYVGLMEKKTISSTVNELLAGKKTGRHVVAIGCFSKSTHRQLDLHCKEVCLVIEADKSNWQILPRARYPKPLIFHDGRLAFLPTPLATLAMFMWLPLGVLLAVFRMVIGLLLPYEISSPILAFTGTRTTVTKAKQSFTSTKENGKPTATGVLYACNHRTLLDPIYVSLALTKPVSAVTYSMSRFNEIISPLRTVRLTRDREQDKILMDKMLRHGDLVVCPEGTTCREPYLLRFSPLFAEMANEIIPVAIDVKTSMFYGSTASGLKCFDPLFHFLNPCPEYFIRILKKLPCSACRDMGGALKFEIANQVQNQIANALSFKCTNLTRKDKYMILAGNDGIVK